MGRKAVFHQERGQFSTPWHLEEASSDGWQPSKILPSCWHENLPGLCGSHLILGGWGANVRAVPTVLGAPDLSLAYKSGPGEPSASWWELPRPSQGPRGLASVPGFFLRGTHDNRSLFCRGCCVFARPHLKLHQGPRQEAAGGRRQAGPGAVLLPTAGSRPWRVRCSCPAKISLVHSAWAPDSSSGGSHSLPSLFSPSRRGLQAQPSPVQLCPGQLRGREYRWSACQGQHSGVPGTIQGHAGLQSDPAQLVEAHFYVKD